MPSTKLFFCLLLLVFSIDGRHIKRDLGFDIEHQLCGKEIIPIFTRAIKDATAKGLCNRNIDAEWFGQRPETTDALRSYCCKLFCSRRHLTDFYCYHNEYRY
ncbi:hypothetical protein PFISCL1PPCAC_2143 [Pristionchus fissidentatus]|uniref:Insulin-like domain-containing protein n=1 Tax=Pristionchus fissidentatus TaxID=1538716 RepID=A0AAV5UUA7_9BILA|nr:hypothetical protein PFISCL1PPCAC_2143 [Pristionchus fissidentatus]